VINEKPSKAHPPNSTTGLDTAGTLPGVRDGHGKVWIDGVGFMKNGRQLNDGRNKVTDRMLHAH